MSGSSGGAPPHSGPGPQGHHGGPGPQGPHGMGPQGPHGGTGGPHGSHMVQGMPGQHATHQPPPPPQNNMAATYSMHSMPPHSMPGGIATMSGMSGGMQTSMPTNMPPHSMGSIPPHSMPPPPTMPGNISVSMATGIPQGMQGMQAGMPQPGMTTSMQGGMQSGMQGGMRHYGQGDGHAPFIRGASDDDFGQFVSDELDAGSMLPPAHVNGDMNHQYMGDSTQHPSMAGVTHIVQHNGRVTVNLGTTLTD